MSGGLSYAAAVSTPNGTVRQPQIQAKHLSDPDLRSSFESQKSVKPQKPQRPGAGIRSKTSFRGWSSKKDREAEKYERGAVQEVQYQRVTRAEHEPNTGGSEDHVYVLTLKLEDSLADPMNKIRDQYFPRRLNRTGAHLTLFHALPHSQIEQLNNGLSQLASSTKPFQVTTGGPFRMRLGVGVNVDAGYQNMKDVHSELKSQWMPFLSEQDQGRFRPHWTVMNKVNEEEEVEHALSAVRKELSQSTKEGQAIGLELWKYDRGNWIFASEYAFGDVKKTSSRPQTSGAMNKNGCTQLISRTAIILVGGFGTRLRPLTLTLPKPLVEFANKPMIQHQIEALASAGVTDVVLAVNYRPEIMAEALKTYEKQYNVKIEFSVETEPLGTAGPLKLAERILGKDDSPFFVLNADVTCDYPFAQLAEFHKQHGGEGTIVVTKVEEPSKYGVVVHKPGHASQIDRFVEKPVEFVGNRINAGIYILNPSVLNRIELRPTSIEQETFPAIVKDGLLHSFDLEGFWMDVGQPKDFIAGTCLYLSSLSRKNSNLLTPASEPFVYGGNVLIDPSAKIGKNCRIGPNVTIGPNVVVGDGVRLQRCVILKNCRIKDHAWVKSTIVGWNSTVGKWARLENVTVLGDDVSIGDEVYVNGGSVLPHKSIKQNVDTPSIIM
ncbi:hypothetical protein CC86DRAFT_391462 [Ophiobolus disseminans]|uniref:Mannose-1-phosphate guanyltransferase n=1 Tax=Ophiobolus disseminans TaxID=1469910 RepID=A0A6A7ACY4_9PLEO|nr:hypothetical protein CC86DRAFT_391462 [Ophiobolus disseminans]